MRRKEVLIKTLVIDYGAHGDGVMVGGFASGNHIMTCPVCDTCFTGDYRSTKCLECAIKEEARAWK